MLYFAEGEAAAVAESDHRLKVSRPCASAKQFGAVTGSFLAAAAAAAPVAAAAAAATAAAGGGGR